MEKLLKILEGEPKFRQKQVFKAWFDLNIKSYIEITTLTKVMREKLKDLDWMSVKEFALQVSKKDGTVKALLELDDKNRIETVLMNRIDRETGRTRYTVCISTQVGCPMKCLFCATGKLGLKRNLNPQELVDQVRFWQKYLNDTIGENARIGNVVLMGQGEPLLNYENVKESLNIILGNTDIGHNHITISSVGVPDAMEKLVEDIDFPPVRFALSLHSATPEVRSKLIPSHPKDFFEFFIDWSKKYHERFSSRAHFISIEYVMLKGLNDSEKDLKALIELLTKLGSVRVNLIPFNSVCGEEIQGSSKATLENWQDKIAFAGFYCTTRRSQGQDIDAACGQLALKSEK